VLPQSLAGFNGAASKRRRAEGNGGRDGTGRRERWDGDKREGGGRLCPSIQELLRVPILHLLISALAVCIKVLAL